MKRNSGSSIQLLEVASSRYELKINYWLIYTIALYQDFSKAFDAVNHDILISKKKKRKRKNVYSNKKYLILQCLHI